MKQQEEATLTLLVSNVWQSGDGCVAILHEFVQFGHEIHLYQAIQGRCGEVVLDL